MSFNSMMFKEKIAFSKNDNIKIKKLLNSLSLKYEEDIEYSVMILDDDTLIGTGSLSGNILKCIAVSEKYRSLDLTSKIITHLVNHLQKNGIYHYFLYTKSENEFFFSQLGFTKIVSVYYEEEVVLMEGGNLSIDKFLTKISEKSYSKSGAIIMNCNPMTKGHLFLIEKAASMVNILNIFLVSANLSSFPFEDRFEIVKNEIKKFKNVELYPTGPYQVSNSTFPTYFLKKKDNSTKFQTMFDVTIFCEKFAEYFNIEKRFVGTEPYCELTESYNETMKEILPEYGIEFVKINRKEINNSAISASRVRKLLREDKIEEAFNLIPDSTKIFLQSIRGKKIIEKLQSEDTIH